MVRSINGAGRSLLDATRPASPALQTKPQSAQLAVPLVPSTRRNIDGSFGKARSLDPVEVADTNDPQALAEKIRSSRHKTRLLIVTDVWRQVKRRQYDCAVPQLRQRARLESRIYRLRFDLLYAAPDHLVCGAAEHRGREDAVGRWPASRHLLTGRNRRVLPAARYRLRCSASGSCVSALSIRVHLMTEGPLGRAWKQYLLQKRRDPAHQLAVHQLGRVWQRSTFQRPRRTRTVRLRFPDEDRLHQVSQYFDEGDCSSGRYRRGA